MQFKSLITCSAMVLVLGIGSAVAADPVEKKSIMPQKVHAMTAADLETVRGTWHPGGAISGKPAVGHTTQFDKFGGCKCPPGQGGTPVPQQ